LIDSAAAAWQLPLHGCVQCRSCRLLCSFLSRFSLAHLLLPLGCLGSCDAPVIPCQHHPRALQAWCLRRWKKGDWKVWKNGSAHMHGVS
jgi:hypothetical protein